jgi:hypothetical protein
MKKILVVVCFLFIAAACTTQPIGNNNMRSNANSAEKKTTAMPSEADIIAKEKATWDAVKKKDWDAFGKMIANDYIEILDNGVHDKTATLANIKDLEISDVTFADWKVLPIDKDAVMLTYSATVKGTFKGEAFPAGPYREAAAYVNRDGQWLAIYFQETLASTAPPPPPPAADKKKENAPASPMAKPGEPGPDPIANEKIVWDYFKSRNYDGFATLLAQEFIEVEANAFYDKAGSVKGVQEFDATQFELSDWKSVKFDDDAALVAYTVTPKDPKAPKEYHSSIWVNRDGKWLALYHHGTPAAKPAPKK